jgi:hypothetical protein
MKSFILIVCKTIESDVTRCCTFSKTNVARHSFQFVSSEGQN